jgi:hypothetical protein
VRRLWISAVVLSLFVCGCASSSGAAATRTVAGGGRWTTLSLSGWASVEAPARWHTTTYRGEPAAVYFPLRFLSSQQLTGPCATGSASAACTTQNWFPDDWRTPADGVIVLWSHAEFPEASGSGLSHAPGRRTTIDNRSAKVWSGAATSRCPAGAGTETDASVREVAHSSPGDRFDMTACFGKGVTRQDRSAVGRMLHSLSIHK